jgi:transcriptional regulator with XRE-family HTH domain
MKYAKKSAEAQLLLRRTLIDRLSQAEPDIPQACRWIREAVGLNQEDFARLIGLSRPQLARIERGEANPTLESLLAIGKPFGLKLGFIRPDQMLARPSGDPAQEPAPPKPTSARARAIRMQPLTFKKKP